MIKKILIGISASFLVLSQLPALENNLEFNLDDPLNLQNGSMEDAAAGNIIINNRILATINGNPISVIDLKKKMDMAFHKHFPNLLDSEISRYQFYMTNWMYFLKETIDNELIFADAKEKQIPVTSGDVREELETLFGPNIINTIDQMGYTYENVWSMIEKEIHVRRMVYFMIRSKAMDAIHPRDMREAYASFAKENKRPNEWHYQVITIRGESDLHNLEVSENIHQLLQDSEGSIDMLLLQMDTVNTHSDSVTVTVSQEFCRSDANIGIAHKNALLSLEAQEFSKPIKQDNRTDNTSLYRIFYLNQFFKEASIAFHEVEEQLQEQLFQDAMEEEAAKYLTKLRHHFGFDEHMLQDALPKNFQPFVLQ